MRASYLFTKAYAQRLPIRSLICSGKTFLHTGVSPEPKTSRVAAAEARLPTNVANSLLCELKNALKLQQNDKQSRRALRQALFEAAATVSSETQSLSAQLAQAARKAPGHYAALRSVLAHLALRRPGWTPNHVLDVASTSWGMGVLAAVATWRSRELCSTVFDANPTRLAASRAWLGDCVESRSYLEPDNMYDLITAVHCRSEGSASERSMAFFENLWSHCRDVLVIVEPGNADGFAHMTAVRSHLLQLHGSSITVAAPCPHTGPCPLNGKESASLAETGPSSGFRHSFCHFAQRYERERTLRQMSSLDHANRRVMPSSESQGTRRFSYVVLERVRQGGETSPATEMKHFQARVLREPLKRNGHVVLYLCRENQRIERHTYTRRKHADGTYRHARRASWGDEWTHPVTTAGVLAPIQASPPLTSPSPFMDHTDLVDDRGLNASTKTIGVANSIT